MVLLAQTRQADRDKALTISDAQQRDALAAENLKRQDEAVAEAEQLRALLVSNTKLTAQTAQIADDLDRLTKQIHRRVCADGP